MAGVSNPNNILIAFDNTNDPILINLGNIDFIECKQAGVSVDITSNGIKKTVKIDENQLITILKQEIGRWPDNQIVIDVRG